MSKDDSFINPFVKIRMPDVFDPSIFFRTTATTPPNVTDQPEASFLLEDNIKSLETESPKVPCEDFLEGNKQIETIDQQQIQNIINKNIEYLKDSDISNVTGNGTKSSHFPSSQSESRLLSPIDKHLNFLGDVSKSRGQSPFEKCVGYINDHQFGFQTSAFSYSSTPSEPFSTNIGTDLLSGFTSTNEDNQQSLLTNIEECRTLQYLDLAKKDPFFGQNPVLPQVNSKDPFLFNAAIKADSKSLPGLCNQRMTLARSCEDIQSQASPSFQLQDANYFNFPSTLDEPTQLDYLDLATLDFLTNPNFTYSNSVLKDKGWKDDDIYSENNLVYHEQSNELASETLTLPERHIGTRQSVEEPARFGQRKVKNLRLKKSKSDLGNPNKVCLIPDSQSYDTNLTRRGLAKSESGGTKKPNRKRKMSETRFDRYRLMPKESFGYAGKRLCKSNKIFNVSQQLTGFTDEEKESMKAVLGRGDCIYVKKQIGENKKPVVVVEDIPASIVKNLYRSDESSNPAQNPNVANYGKTDHCNVIDMSPEHSKEKKLTSVLKLKCQECRFSCHSVQELKEHSVTHKTETEVATEAISVECTSQHYGTVSDDNDLKEKTGHVMNNLFKTTEDCYDDVASEVINVVSPCDTDSYVDVEGDSNSPIAMLEITDNQSPYETTDSVSPYKTTHNVSTYLVEDKTRKNSGNDAHGTTGSNISLPVCTDVVSVANVTVENILDKEEVDANMFLNPICLSSCVTPDIVRSSSQVDASSCTHAAIKVPDTGQLEPQQDVTNAAQDLLDALTNKNSENETVIGPIDETLPAVLSESVNIAVVKKSESEEVIEITIMECANTGTVDFGAESSVCEVKQTGNILESNGCAPVVQETSTCGTFFLGQTLSETLDNKSNTNEMINDAVEYQYGSKPETLHDNRIKTETLKEKSTPDVRVINTEKATLQVSEVEYKISEPINSTNPSSDTSYDFEQQLKTFTGTPNKEINATTELERGYDNPEADAFVTDHKYQNFVSNEILEETKVFAKDTKMLRSTTNRMAKSYRASKFDTIIDNFDQTNNNLTGNYERNRTLSDGCGTPLITLKKSNSESSIGRFTKVTQPEAILKDKRSEPKFGKVICLGVTRHDGTRVTTLGMKSLLKDSKSISSEPSSSTASQKAEAHRGNSPIKAESGKAKVVALPASAEIIPLKVLSADLGVDTAVEIGNSEKGTSIC